ncbi:histidine phosphatase superfamily [Aspergillus ambiguus]|uniref:uncharacterized protein n=1 Tax=Aspergillus ambiguus TaxID=176160 RepID=UPI003CCCD26D
MLVPSHLFTLAAALQASLTIAQDMRLQVWGVFAYTLHGETIPPTGARPDVLSSYGANQLYEAGSAFRDRYVAVDDGHSMRIESLSPYVLEPEEISILSKEDASTVASAQAFMQGLYPPLNDTMGAVYYDPSFELANGSLAMGPLNGYQYPHIRTYGPSDYQSTVVDGQDSCLMHTVAEDEYKSSHDFEQMKETTEAFYQSIYDQVLSGILDRSQATYANAYYISEFLDYQSIHNDSLLHHLNQEDIDMARYIADHYMFATNGDTSPDGVGSSAVRTVAGKTLAGSILQSFQLNNGSRGVNGKMTLMFGGYEPMVALTSLMGLASPEHASFYSRPAHGASIVLELFSLETDEYPTYPDPSQLYVRFALRNGTESPQFQTYPLFGLGPSNIAMPYNEFESEMRKFALNSTEEWCLLCNTDVAFCSAYASNPPQDHKNKNAGHKGMAPGVAGVIGAVVTLVTVGLVAVVGFALCGLRMGRIRKRSLGGYKGDRKMASDTDVAFRNPSWGDAKEAETHDGQMAHGHERHGSWEMRAGGATLTTPTWEENVRSPLDDDVEDWRVHTIQQPVQAREHI